MFTATTTERLALRLFCYRRQQRWDTIDQLPQRISNQEISALAAQLNQFSPEELQRIEKHFTNGGVN